MNYFIFFIIIIVMAYYFQKYMKYKNKYINGGNNVKAVCIVPIKEHKNIIYLTELEDNTTEITGIIKGLNPNQKHAIHIHETGDLTEGCTSCCAHYNPYGKKHGSPNASERHIGDLGNLEANEEGIAEFKIKDKLVKLSGIYSVIGRSIVIHEDEDDLGLGGHDDSHTTGHAGSRIGCGVIGLRRNC
jgi:Cu-Zn family superoxide dismutase